MSEFGNWDVLPEDPPEDRLDLTDPAVKDMLERRGRLVEQWQAYYAYPHGVWRDRAIQAYPKQAEAWRNWFLRRSWEGISLINGSLGRYAR